MKTIEEMTIQEMVKELAYHESHENGPKKYDRMNELTRALDEKCVAAGVHISEDGMLFLTGDLDYSLTYDAEGEVEDLPLVIPLCPAADLHALIGYLLSKKS